MTEWYDVVDIDAALLDANPGTNYGHDENTIAYDATKGALKRTDTVVRKDFSAAADLITADQVTAAVLRVQIDVLIGSESYLWYRGADYDWVETAACWDSKKPFSHCYYYDGAAFTDRSVEARSSLGAFTLLADTNDLLYFGSCGDSAWPYYLDPVKFGGVKADIATPASPQLTLVLRYWNGSSWVTPSNIVDGTSGFTVDGEITWTIPADWALCTVNGLIGYWMYISTTTTVNTPPTANCCAYPWTGEPGGGKTTPFGSPGTPTGAGYFSFDVLAIVQDAVTNRAKIFNAVGFCSTTTMTASIRFDTRVDATALFRPTLIITYNPPAAGGGRTQVITF